MEATTNVTARPENMGEHKAKGGIDPSTLLDLASQHRHFLRVLTR
jgi:hypothetical protein